MNMGHETEQITDIHYGQLSDERRFAAMESAYEEANHVDIFERISDAELGSSFREFLKTNMTSS